MGFGEELIAWMDILADEVRASSAASRANASPQRERKIVKTLISCDSCYLFFLGG